MNLNISCCIERAPLVKQGTPKSVTVPGRSVSLSSRKPEITVQGNYFFSFSWFQVAQLTFHFQQMIISASHWTSFPLRAFKICIWVYQMTETHVLGSLGQRSRSRTGPYLTGSVLYFLHTEVFYVLEFLTTLYPEFNLPRWLSG